MQLFFSAGKYKWIRWGQSPIVIAIMGDSQYLYVFTYIVNISLLSYEYRHCLGTRNVSGKNINSKQVCEAAYTLVGKTDIKQIMTQMTRQWFAVVGGTQRWDNGIHPRLCGLQSWEASPRPTRKAEPKMLA